jgi:hypothetical protein
MFSSTLDSFLESTLCAIADSFAIADELLMQPGRVKQLTMARDAIRTMNALGGSLENVLDTLISTESQKEA